MKELKTLIGLLIIIGFIYLLNDKISLNSNINKPNQNKPQTEQVVETPNPKILKKAFAKEGTLIVAKGEEEYLSTYREPKYWNLGFRELNMDLIYQYGLGIDMSKIDVLGFDNDGSTVIIQIPKNQIKLDYIKLDMDQSKINGDSSFAVKGFNPTEVKVQLTKSEDKVKDKLLKDKYIFEEGKDSLKDTIKGIAMKMGFTQVLFEE